MSLANNLKGKFPSKILVFVMTTAHNCSSFSCWSQMFHYLPSICEGIILPSKIGFFERAFWVHQKFSVTKRHFCHKRYFKFFLFISRKNVCYRLKALKYMLIIIVKYQYQTLKKTNSYHNLFQKTHAIQSHRHTHTH